VNRELVSEPEQRAWSSYEPTRSEWKAQFRRKLCSLVPGTAGRRGRTGRWGVLRMRRLGGHLWVRVSACWP